MPLHVSSTMCSSSESQKLYYTASGIITLLTWPSGAQVKRGLCLNLCTGRPPTECDDV